MRQHVPDATGSQEVLGGGSPLIPPRQMRFASQARAAIERADKVLYLLDVVDFDLTLKPEQDEQPGSDES